MTEPPDLTQDQLAIRLRNLLPVGWFPSPPATGEPEQAPVLNGLLQGAASVLQWVWELFQQVYSQQRLETATGGMLEIYAGDFYGSNLPRETAETDDAYRARIKATLFPMLGTRSSIENALTEAWGDKWLFIEPRNASDTKGLASLASPAVGGGYGYGTSGLRYGSRLVPFQGFVFLTSTPTFLPPATVTAAVEKIRAGGVMIWMGGSASLTDFEGEVL